MARRARGTTPTTYRARQPNGRRSICENRIAPRPCPQAPSAASMPTPQPRCAAGSSSVTMTNATAVLVTKNVRASACSSTNINAVAANAVAKVTRPSTSVEAMNTGLRPMRSASGTSKNAGTAPRRISASCKPKSRSTMPSSRAICLSAEISIDEVVLFEEQRQRGPCRACVNAWRTIPGYAAEETVVSTRDSASSVKRSSKTTSNIECPAETDCSPWSAFHTSRAQGRPSWSASRWLLKPLAETPRVVRVLMLDLPDEARTTADAERCGEGFA